MSALPLLFASGCERPIVAGADSGGSGFASTTATLTEVHVDFGGDDAPDGAWVILQPSGRDAPIDRDGIATFESLDAGTYTVTAAAPGFATGEATLSVDADAGGEATLTLDAVNTDDAAIDAVVRDANRDPIVDATVWLNDVEVATTDADGAFLLDALPSGPHDLRITPPDDAGFADWVSPGLTLTAGATATLDLTMASVSPAGSNYIGSDACIMCHAAEGSAWADSAHARAQRSVDQLTADDPDGLAAQVALGRPALLNPTVAGAAILLEDLGDGTWSATVRDARGASVGPYTVRSVYGGHRRAAALIADDGDRRLVLPATWLTPIGADSHADAELAPAWTSPWFDANGDVQIPTDDANFDLNCAGCHATGHRLVEDSGAWSLTGSDGDDSPEETIGCEACHGAGQAHFGADDVQRRLTILDPDRLPASRQVDVCSGCHQALSTADHPFSAPPGWPVDENGDALNPAQAPADQADDASDTWLALDASRVPGDTVGELRASPHMRNADGYAGNCGDCHVPHGGAEDTLLRAPAGDNSLCTGCHATRFPDADAEAAHANHPNATGGAWGANSCTSCHMPRLSTRVATDPVSEAGDTHAHTLWSGRPDAALAEFDAAGTDDLNPGEVPVSPCLDCHLQQAELADCDCPVGNPGHRSTYESLQESWDAWREGSQ